MDHCINILRKHSLKLLAAENIQLHLLHGKPSHKGSGWYLLYFLSHFPRELVWKQHAPVHLVIVLPAPRCVLVLHESSYTFKDVCLLLLPETLIHIAYLDLRWPLQVCVNLRLQLLHEALLKLHTLLCGCVTPHRGSGKWNVFWQYYFNNIMCLCHIYI